MENTSQKQALRQQKQEMPTMSTWEILYNF